MYDAAKQERFRKFFIDHGTHKKTKIFRILQTSEPTQDNKDSNDNKNPQKKRTAAIALIFDAAITESII
jgi:hypothetical protein